ncbi:hypothetical protein [Actinoplanes sp. NPDC049118]|uniref:hypothetical protein n=1 Tax=Actinoplanes sp. NPDC049118 TaxID=3155769 RepID=UPI0033C04F0C
MDIAMDVAYTVVDDLFGPGSVVPWWAWAATLLLIFGRLLAPVFQPDSPPGQNVPAVKPPPVNPTVVTPVAFKPPPVEFRAAYFPASHFASDRGN